MNAFDMSNFASVVAARGAIPLSWAGSTMKMNYLNWGDALSPVMVALCTGQQVERVPFNSHMPRMVAVGTVGHAIEGGTVWVWGTGCSNHRNPSAPSAERIPYVPPPGTNMHIQATRGPVSAALMSGAPVKPGAVFGDPVWLLPRFYPSKVEKKWDLGVILHLSELADRDLEAHPLAHYLRYQVPADGSVHLINTVTPISAGGLRTKLDEILACRRLVSTSLHGMVLAESYGIPCVYFPPNGPAEGLTYMAPTANSGLDLRIVDLYQGLGVERLPVYVQDRQARTDWDRLINVIDETWRPSDLNGDALLQALPIEPSPISARPGETIFEHPLITEIQFQHDVGELNRQDRIAARALGLLPGPTTKAAAPEQTLSKPEIALQSAAAKLAAPLVTTDAKPPRTLQAIVDELGAVPVSWAAPTRQNPYPNFGDALSAVMVGTIAGLPVVQRNFDDRRERMAAVGTIGHALKNGLVHFWGTGLDDGRFPALPADTDLIVHAMRGPQSADVLRRFGISAPAVYGDPVWFLPKMLPRKPQPPAWELGVIVHISELNEYTPEATVKEAFRRYEIPPALRHSVRVINTFTERSTEGLLRKVDEILSCRRIASTSFHGLLIADTYGVPGVWFGTQDNGPAVIDVTDPACGLDHRFRDFYCGCKGKKRPIYRTERHRLTDWDALIRWIDESWTPVEFDPAPLLEAFPLRRAVSLEDKIWTVNMRALASFVP